MVAARGNLQRQVRAALSAVAILVSSHALAGSTRLDSAPDELVTLRALAAQLAVGDVVFIRVDAKPFREVAAATGTWTNHVGIVVDTSGDEPMIAESTFPLSRTTRLSRFVGRSENGRVAVRRSGRPLSPDEVQRVKEAASRRTGIFYDTGFDLHSRREFCSRYVREVLREATGVTVGDVETFGDLLRQHPEANQAFWRVWYFGRIPWNRETVTPESVLRSPLLVDVFNGAVRCAPNVSS